MRLHVIGDSHTGAFRTIGAVDISAPSQFTSPSPDEALILTSVESGIFIHYLGSMTAYRVGRDKLSAFNLNDYYVKPNDNVCYVFGEIDCRCNVHKHLDQTVSYQDNINYLIDEYVDTIKLNHEKFDLGKSIVYNVVPTAKYNSVSHWDHGNNPYLGSDEERKYYTLYFNQRLKSKCKQFGIHFFDVYDKFISDDGFMKEDISHDGLHVDPQSILVKDILSSYMEKL